MTTYADLTAQAAALELAAISPVQAAFEALQTAITTAQAALAGGTSGSRTIVFLTNAMNNTVAQMAEGQRIVMALTPAPAPAASPAPGIVAAS